MSSFTNDPKKMNRKEEEIYNILYQKKEINDKTPKFRTEDEKKKLKSLSYKISKINKNLIDDIITKFPFLQRKPKTAEQRKEQIRIIQHNKRSEESEIDKEKRLNKQKEYENEKRSGESEIDKEMRQTQDKEYHSRKRSAESEIYKQMRLTKDKITKHKRYTQSTQLRAKISQQLREKRSAESKIDKEMRLNKQKEYNEKRSAESDIGKKGDKLKTKLRIKKHIDSQLKIGNKSL